jgi:VanZ family protein
MLPLRHARRWQLGGITVLILVLAGTLLPAVSFMQEMRDPRFAHSDKWLHAITFLFLTVWFAGQYSRKSYWRIAAGLLAFGAFIEICQRMLTTWRSAETMDLVADAIGVAAGLLIAYAGAGGWSLRVEQWIAARE